MEKQFLFIAVLLAMVGVAYGFDYPSKSGGSFSNGDNFLSTDANALDTALDSLESDTADAPPVDTQTISSPFHAINDDRTYICALDGVKDNSGNKTKCVGTERTIANLTASEAYSYFVTVIGGGDTDTNGMQLSAYCTGGAFSAGDEGCNGIRISVEDNRSTPQGILNGSLPATTGVLTVDTGTSITKDESMYVGEGKLMVFTGSQVQVTINSPLPAGTVDSSGVLAPGYGVGSKVWSIPSSEITSSGVAVGWCFATASSAYTDANGFSTNTWLYITAVGTSSVTTEFMAQGDDMGLPQFMRADTGSLQGLVAPCAKVTKPIFDTPDDQIVDQIEINKAASFTQADGAAFVLPSYPMHTNDGVKVVIRQRQGSRQQGNGFSPIVDLTQSPAYQIKSFVDPGFTGSVSNLAYGHHAAISGIDCGTGDCQKAVKYSYGSDSSVQEWFGEVDFDNTRWAAQNESFVVMRTNDSSSMNLTLHPLLGWGANGTPFSKSTASGTANLGTVAIASGACASVVTVAASSVATTDVISWTPNADISTVTGYTPATTGGLSIYAYPTAGNVNFKVCNPTSASITPGAVTLNWRVDR